MRIEPLYKDSLVTITDGSITFHGYSIWGSDRTVALKDIQEIRVLKPTIWNGNWRLHGSGNFRTWFPADYARPTRNAIFVAILHNAWWRIGFTVKDSAQVLGILKDKGLVKEDVALPAGAAGAESAASYRRVVLGLLLAVHLCLGPLLLGASLYFRTHLPGHINGTYGHRTSLSMKSQEAWDEAQRFSTNAMIIAAVVVIACQVFSLCTMMPGKSMATSFAVLIVAVLAVGPLTDWHLKKHFDADGRRATAPITIP